MVVGGKYIRLIFRLLPPYVIPTGAKRNGGILAVPCIEPGTEDPSASLRCARDDRAGGGVRKSHPHVMTTGAQAEWRNPGTALR